ncbi:MAG TPA: hypothetical protein VHL54_01600 [Actinomycetota bacterium]|nr:hypothetical protein [Actinomycetota bacterium]
MEGFDSPGPQEAGRLSAGEVLEWGSRLASELDPRLADVWSCVFSIESEPTLEQLGWFLRMAYLNGYEDGITETTRGKLLEELGMTAPNRSTTNQEGARRR